MPDTVGDLIQAMYVLLGAYHQTHDAGDAGVAGDAWLARARDCRVYACAQARTAVKAHDAAVRAENDATDRAAAQLTARPDRKVTRRA